MVGWTDANETIEGDGMLEKLGWVLYVGAGVVTGLNIARWLYDKPVSPSLMALTALCMLTGGGLLLWKWEL